MQFMSFSSTVGDDSCGYCLQEELKSLSDCDVLEMVNSRRLPLYKIERAVGDYERGVRLRYRQSCCVLFPLSFLLSNRYCFASIAFM